ncbi:grpE protein homolog, mitochondrial [Ctenocephalides felis]|uniref:grpE protein homolog, mitochondrial n=1 Tax=Ctenocephalides felis TaxID=7515 RepID=UPI000E6E473F|nr:grpE protein homolog, mitochondrial [Ctenocephalides felis]
MAIAMKTISIRSLLKLARSAFPTYNEKFQPLLITQMRTAATKEAQPEETVDPLQVIAEKILGKGELTDNERKLVVEIDRLTKEVGTLSEDKLELDDKYKRSLADRENVRQRLTKQIEEAKQFGIQGFCKDLIEVADVLDTATKAVPIDEVNEKNPHLKNLYEGLTMTNASLKQMFGRHKLEPVDPLNLKFDPNFHEALTQQEVKDKEAGMVVSVIKIGYKLHERCLRPALVCVSKSP